MRFAACALCVIFFLIACSNATNNSSEAKESMKQADIAFSNLSRDSGMQTAFLRYLDTGAVLLRADHYPLIGADAKQYLLQNPDSGFTLTWTPSDAQVAASGDLGYTYGIYTFASEDTSFKGTYVSIWKKQADGSWKYVLDTGNPGVGE